MDHLTQKQARVIAVLTLAGVMLAACLLAMLNRTERWGDFAASTPIAYRIDPNTADAQTLCLLPEVGPGIAYRIITDRQVGGPFRSADDLTRVSMIGDKTLAALRPWVTFGDEN